MKFNVKATNNACRVGQYVVNNEVIEIDIDTINFFYLIVLQRFISTNSIVAVNENGKEDNSKTYELSIAITAKFN